MIQHENFNSFEENECHLPMNNFHTTTTSAKKVKENKLYFYDSLIETETAIRAIAEAIN